MSIAYGSDGTSSNVNSAFMSRTQDTTAAGKIDQSNTTDSTLPTNGALHTAGGLGVEKNANIGGDASVQGAVSVADATQSTDKDTGSIVTEGGLGVEKNINAGGNVTAVGSMGASNLSGTNTGNVTLGAIGSSPNANGVSLSGVTGQVLNLEPANDTHGGVLSNTTQDIKGNKTFKDSVIIDGDLTVNGTTTTLNTTNLEVEDQNVLINNGGNDATSEDAGIDVERTTTNAAIRFDSALPSYWKVGLVSALREIIVSGVAQTISGIKDFTSGIKVNSINESSLDVGVTIETVLIEDGLVDGRDVSVDGTAQDSHIADASIHFTVGSISHTAITNIGTNTHAQIDTHIANTSNPHSVTKTQVGLGNVTDDAQLKRAAGDYNSFTSKGTPIAADVVLIEDSADSFNKKKITLTDLLGGLSSPLTTKGDLYTHDATVDARLPVGTNGQVLTADSAQSTGLKWADAGFTNPVTDDLTMTASDTFVIDTTKMMQTFRVQGNSAAVSLSATPFGATPPPNGAFIYLVGNSDTNTVTVIQNDAADGCLMDGDITLAKGKVVGFMYLSSLDRYVRL